MRSITVLSVIYGIIIITSIIWALQLRLGISDWLALLGVLVFGAMVMFELFNFIFRSREAKITHSKVLVKKNMQFGLKFPFL